MPPDELSAPMLDERADVSLEEEYTMPPLKNLRRISVRLRTIGRLSPPTYIDPVNEEQGGF